VETYTYTTAETTYVEGDSDEVLTGVVLISENGCRHKRGRSSERIPPAMEAQ
jgi:hypothetical protein